MNAPKLRFKEFYDEWINECLSNIATITMGQSPNSKNYTSNKNDIILIQGNADLNNGHVVPRIFTTQITKTCSINDIIMTVRAPVGDTAISDYNACIGRGVCAISGDKYIYHYLNYLKIKDYWKKISKGSTIDSITSNDIRNLSINLPNSDETKKIVKTLDLLDKKIELQSKKIEDLKLFKKGLIKNFYNEYNLRQIKIKEIGKIVTGTTPSKSINSYWDNGNITWVTPTDINDSRDINDSFFKITDKGLNKGKFIPKNSVLVTCIASIGKNAVLKVDGSCNQQINAIIPNKNFNYNYVYYLIESMSNYMKSIAGTSATSIINKEEFSRIIVKVHSKEKQDYIASVLSQFEIKILLEISKLNKFYQLKKGLMQNMFV